MKQAKPKTIQPPKKKEAFNIKSYIKNGISEQTVIFAKESFDLFDSDHGGTIDSRELKAAITSLGFQSKNAAIFQMISDLTVIGTERLTSHNGCICSPQKQVQKTPEQT